jgi:hypothetical protein
MESRSPSHSARPLSSLQSYPSPVERTAFAPPRPSWPTVPSSTASRCRSDQLTLSSSPASHLGTYPPPTLNSSTGSGDWWAEPSPAATSPITPATPSAVVAPQPSNSQESPTPSYSDTDDGRPTPSSPTSTYSTTRPCACSPPEPSLPLPPLPFPPPPPLPRRCHDVSYLILAFTFIGLTSSVISIGAPSPVNTY